MGAALTAVLLLAATASAQQTIPMKFGRAPPAPRTSVIVPGFGWPFYERDVVHHVYEREVIREVPAEPAPPPPPPRKAFAIGRSYDSLPGGCMKMVEGGASYFYCGGDWYREVGRSLYQAVASPF
jgi:hypothetical protein